MQLFTDQEQRLQRRQWLAGLLAATCAWPAARASRSLRLGGTGVGLALLDELQPLLPAGLVAAGANASLGSGGGIKALLAGQLDLALSSRPLTEAEQARGLRQVAWLDTPLVWATSATRPEQGLSTEELAQIYSGARTQWPSGQPLRPVLRPDSDSDTAMIRRLGPAMSAALDAAYRRPGLRVALTDLDAVEDLVRITGSVGSTTLALTTLSRGALKALALDGVVPAPGSHRYPLHKAVQLVLPEKPLPEAEVLVRALLAPPAQAALARLGCRVLTPG